MSNDLAATPSADLISSVPLPVGQPPHDRLAAIMDKEQQLRAIATDLFPGPVAIEVEEDPEIDGWRYLVFTVSAPHDLKEVARRRLEWFRLTADLLGADVDLVHLFPIFS